MNFDFPTLLVAVTFLSGLIWLIDAILFAPRRAVLAEQAEEENAGPEVVQARLREPTLVEYARSFFPVFLIVLLLRSFLVEPFRIPSSSMMPTLLVGDFILVNKFTYGIRLPVINKKIIEMGEPQRGDVVVFKYPQNPSIDYIKRVIGLPGDRISYNGKMLTINDQPIPQTSVGRYIGAGAGANETGYLQSMERLGDIEHAVLVRPGTPDFAPGCQTLARGPVTVPQGYYFVMGDNRDNSNDSRCWGWVPEQNLVGKAFGIWMSWDSDRSGFPIAWERLGQGIE